MTKPTSGYFYLTNQGECKFMTSEETNEVLSNVVDLIQKRREKEIEKLKTSPLNSSLSAQEIYDQAQKEYLLNRIKNIQENNKMVLQRLKDRKK